MVPPSAESPVAAQVCQGGLRVVVHSMLTGKNDTIAVDATLPSTSDIVIGTNKRSLVATHIQTRPLLNSLQISRDTSTSSIAGLIHKMTLAPERMPAFSPHPTI